MLCKFNTEQAHIQQGPSYYARPLSPGDGHGGLLTFVTIDFGRGGEESPILAPVKSHM